MRRFLLLTVIAVIALTSIATAFDGKRKGFVIGGGIGFAPVTKATSDDPEASDYDEFSYATDVTMGYAFGNRDMILLIGRTGTYLTDERLLSGDPVEVSVTQGFAGLAFRHYFRSEAPSLFVTAGIGAQTWYSDTFKFIRPEERTSILVGVGYEFARHFQVDASISSGTTTLHHADYDNTTIVVTIGGLIF